MANQEHLDILKQGVEVWNQWRQEHANMRPDLRGADLRGAHLQGVDLSDVTLSDANLSYAILRGARLFNADLRGANLIGTSLSYADLSHADLDGANLSDAFLRGADLFEADLREANLREAFLHEASLQKVKLGWTAFGDIDLSQVKGLETVKHEGPSYIDIQTVYSSGGSIPEVFLRQAGVPDSFIEYMHSLVGKPIDYYSCFISYSNKNEDFARRLYADLQSNGVRCWYAPHHLRPGTVIIRGIDEAIRTYDKLLLILSRDSVESRWVEHEVNRALYKEMERKQDVLFPVRIDNAVLESPAGWAADLRHRHIGDFTHWKQHDDYQQAFTRLLRDLKAKGQKPGGDEI